MAKQQTLLEVSPTSAPKQDRYTADQGMFDLMDALTAPILTHAATWKDCLPDRVLNIVTMARMASLLKKERMATLPEVLLFMMTRTFEAPMGHEWTEIYLHVSCTVCQQWFNEDHWDQVHAKKELGEYELKQHLLPLRRWIYERRRQVVKQRMGSWKKEERAAAMDKQPTIVEQQQLELFK